LKASLLILFTLLMQITQVLSAFLNLRFANGILNLEQMTIWVLYLSIIPFLVLFDGNLSVTLSREIAFSKKLKNNRIRVSNLIKSSNYIVNIFLAFMFIVTSLLFIISYNFNGNLDLNVIFATYLFIVSLILKLFSNYSLAKLFALDLILQDRAIKIVSTLINLFFIYFFLHQGFGLYSIGISYILQSLVTIFIVSIIIKRKYTFEIIHKRYKSVIYRLLHPTREYLLIAIPGILVLNSSIFFLKLYEVNNEIIIAYGLSVQILASIMGLSMIIPSTFQPIVSKAFSLKNNYKYKAMNLMKNYYIVVFGIMLNLYLYREEFFTLWIGNYIDNTIFLSLFFVYLLEMIQAPATVFCVAVGYIKFAKITAISSSLILLLSYPALSIWGAYSLAILVLVVQIFTCHQYNIRKFIQLFQVTTQDLFEMIMKLVIPMIAISLIVNFIYYMVDVSITIKIFLSAILTIATIFIISIPDLKRITLWLKN